MALARVLHAAHCPTAAAAHAPTIVPPTSPSPLQVEPTIGCTSTIMTHGLPTV